MDACLAQPEGAPFESVAVRKRPHVAHGAEGGGQLAQVPGGIRRRVASLRVPPAPLPFHISERAPGRPSLGLDE